jgi:hypothetical protein
MRAAAPPTPLPRRRYARQLAAQRFAVYRFRHAELAPCRRCSVRAIFYALPPPRQPKRRSCGERLRYAATRATISPLPRLRRCLRRVMLDAISPPLFDAATPNMPRCRCR